MSAVSTSARLSSAPPSMSGGRRTGRPELPCRTCPRLTRTISPTFSGPCTARRAGRKPTTRTAFPATERQAPGSRIRALSQASVGPVELRLGHADGTAVCLGLLTAGLVAARVAEDPAGEDHGRFGVAVPVRIPAGAQQAVGQFAGQRVAAGRRRLEFDQGPDRRLIIGGAGDLVPCATGDPHAVAV